MPPWSVQCEEVSGPRQGFGVRTPMKNGRLRGGFTLLELMIVVAIIIIIAAISLPGLLRARMTSYESLALASTKAIATAEQMFQSARVADDDRDGQGDFGTLAELANPPGGLSTVAPFIDSVLGTGRKGGYTFNVTVSLGSPGRPPAYTCVASPLTPGTSGTRCFFVDQSSVLRFTSDGSVPDSQSRPVN